MENPNRFCSIKKKTFRGCKIMNDSAPPRHKRKSVVQKIARAATPHPLPRVPDSARPPHAFTQLPTSVSICFLGVSMRTTQFQYQVCIDSDLTCRRVRTSLTLDDAVVFPCWAVRAGGHRELPRTGSSYQPVQKLKADASCTSRLQCRLSTSDKITRTYIIKATEWGLMRLVSMRKTIPFV